MKNSYVFYYNGVPQNSQLYEFQDGNIVNAWYGYEIYNSKFPIRIQGKRGRPQSVDIQQLVEQAYIQQNYENYYNQNQIYNSIRVQGDPNVYINKNVDENVKLMNQQQLISVQGTCTLYLYDGKHNGDEYNVDYDFTTSAGQSPEFYKDVIRNKVLEKCSWLHAIYFDYEFGSDDYGWYLQTGFYYGVIFRNDTHENWVQLINPRIVEKVQGDKTKQQLKGQWFRNALLNEKYEVYNDMSQYYFEVLQNVEYTNLNKCYEIVYNDLGLEIPEKQDSTELMKLIIENQEKLNYFIYNDYTNTIPAKNRYNRQVYISRYYKHIFISQLHENLFIKLDQLNKKMIPSCILDVNQQSIKYCIEYHICNTHNHIYYNSTTLIEVETEQQLNDIYEQYTKNNIYPYRNDSKVFVNGLLFKIKTNCDIKQFLEQFEKSQISVDYKFHENIYSKGVYNKDYMCIDFNKCYAHCVDKHELYNIMEITEIKQYHIDQPIITGNYYLLQDVKHPLIPCNILTGKNLTDISEYINVDLKKYIISEILVKVQYQNKFIYTQDMKKDIINIGIGCMYKLNDKAIYKISPEDSIHIFNNIRINYQFLHCQIINSKISLVLYALQEMRVQWKDILEIHTDALVIPKNDIWNTLEYGNGDKMFKQQNYDEGTYIKTKYGTNMCQQYQINSVLIQAYAGSGKTYYIKQQLEAFRKERKYLDDKCLVLVCKNLNIDQYKQYRDVATVQAYQGIQFQNNYNQLKSYQKIYLDEVYLMDAQFVQKLYTYLQSMQYPGQITFVGDVYQQCNLNCQQKDYKFLQSIQNVKYLKENYRNDIDYQQFIVNGQFDVPRLQLYCIDHNLYFDPQQVTLDNLDTDAVYICKSNDTMANICSLCNQKKQGILINISNEEPSNSVIIQHDVHYTRKGNMVDCIVDGFGKQITSWYGNGVTCYKSQGMQYKKILQHNYMLQYQELRLNDNDYFFQQQNVAKLDTGLSKSTG